MPRTQDFDRDDVLERAKQTFWLKGYNGTSMQDLVDAMGLNRSSIYNSFGSKNELYLMVLERYRIEGKNLQQKVLDKNKTAIESIGLIFLYAMQDVLRDPENKGCMFINCSTELGNQDPELFRIVADNQEEFVSFFEDLVIKGQDEGSIRKGDSKTLAYYLVSAFQGFRVTSMNHKNEKVLKGIIQNILQSLT